MDRTAVNNLTPVAGTQPHGSTTISQGLAGGTIDVQQCRVHQEGPALVAAWVAIVGILFFPVISLAAAPVAIIFYAVPIVTFYVIGRFREAELVGHSVEVTPINFPDIHGRVEAMKHRLGADDLSVRVFVIANGDYNLSMERFGSRRMLVLNSKLIEDMPSPNAVAELDFLIARFIGAFKLRQLRFGPLIFLIALRQIPVAGLLFKPWYRATVLTGDRIGLVASSDLQASMTAMAKLAVGPEGMGGYSMAGHIEQSKRARTGFFYVIYRWSSDFPHMTDRVLDLAAFARNSNAVTVPVGPGSAFDDLNRAVGQA